MSKASGFTLIEVMVALAIIALALSAVSRSLGVTVSNQSHLQSKVVATWVAENAVVERHFMEESGVVQNARPGVQQTMQQTMLKRDWRVEFDSQDTAVSGMKRLSVKVVDVENGQIAASLDSVIGAR